MFTYDSAMLRIGNSRQLFFDNLIVESVQDLTRVLHHPQKNEENPVLTKDQPWEHALYIRQNTFSVLYGEAEKLFRCWYTDIDFHPEKLADSDTWSSTDVMLDRQLYARSKDGITWEKPQLGVIEDSDHKTNVVMGSRKTGSAYSCTYIDDPLESDKSRRFKTIYVDRSAEKVCVRAAYSADGIHWKNYKESPRFGSLGPHLDDVIVLSYDLDSRQYILNTRHWYMYAGCPNTKNPTSDSFFPPYYPDDYSKRNKRRIWQTESSDFIHWGELHLVFAPDEEDNIDDALYGMIQFPVGNMKVGFLNVLHEVSNTMNVQLVYSRDGKNWKRAANRQPWLANGPPDSWDESMIETTNVPVEVGDELWIYYGGSRNHHDWWMTRDKEKLDTIPDHDRDRNKVGYYLGLAKLRLDGYYSLDAGSVREGILVTKPFLSRGNSVVINARCLEGGYVDAEIVDHNDRVFPGYGREDCDTFQGNVVKHALTWKGKEQVPVTSFRKLRFYMRNAEIYSFQVPGGDEEKEDHSPGYFMGEAYGDTEP